MYVNDLEAQLSTTENGGISVGHMKLLLLLYADDVVVFAETAELLQKEIDELHTFCNKWKLLINFDKSKVIVFRKGTRLPRAVWKYGGVTLKVTSQIKYLGIIFTSNGLFHQAQLTLAGQARKGIFAFESRIERFKDLKPPDKMDLFDKFITPILSYGGEVWGFNKGSEIESVHMTFCKCLLSVRRSTQNDFVLGELGRVPMQVMRQCSIIRYWLNIVMGKKSALVNASYAESLATIDDGPQYTWTRFVRKTLFECGYHETWQNQGVEDIDAFLKEFKIKSFNIAESDWQTRIAQSTRADFYRHYKIQLSISPYLSIVTSKANRIAYTRLLTSSHRLRVETGRWEKPRPTPRHQRICYICKKLDDEYHFVLECQALQNLRKQLIPREYWVRPSMEKFIKLLNSEDSHIISKTAEFARKGFHMRENGYRYPHYISILSYIDNHMLRL